MSYGGRNKENWDNWEKVMKLAEKHGFIIQAYGGIATLATHDEQKKAGIYEKTQKMCHGSAFIIKACINRPLGAVSLAIRTINDIRGALPLPITMNKTIDRELEGLVNDVLLPVMPKEAPKEGG